MRAISRFLIALSLVVPLSARAGSFSSLDGSALGPETQALNLWVGFPTLALEYLAGQPDDLDFGFGLTADYMRATADPAFHLRWSLLNREDYNLALRGRVGVHLNAGFTYADAGNAPNVGLRFAPGIAVGMRPHPSYSSIFTLDVPALWTWGYGGGFRLPVVMGMGFEYSMTADLNFVFYGNIGPLFEGGGGHVGGTSLYFEVWSGLAFRLF